MLTKTFTQLLLLAALLYVPATYGQYCMLPGRTSYSVNQPGIANFKLRKINRSSSNVEKPLSEPSIVVTTDSTVLERGKTYVITMKHTRDSVIPTFATARNNIRIWLDYNNDKDFEDAGETIITKDFIMAGVYTDSFTVPLTAALGVTRLRATAKMSSDAGHSIPTPCDNPKDPIDYHGEMEDYTITIVAEGTSVEDITNNANVSLYPNPTDGNLTIAFAQKTDAPILTELFDMTGKQTAVLTNETQQQSAIYNYNMRALGITTGIYFIKITSGNYHSYQKVVLTN